VPHNPFAEDPEHYILNEIHPEVAEYLYNKPAYIKKILDETNSSEDTIKLIQFVCYENPKCSLTVLNELLVQIAYAYAYELRPHLDLLLSVLTIEDSWQYSRILNALKGLSNDREGLFDTINRNKTHYQKRAYQVIKALTHLFSTCPVAEQILRNPEIVAKWTEAVSWLHEELERRPYAPNNQYIYNEWVTPSQSNETSNGYYLERSHSARMTLVKACQLVPEEPPQEPVASYAERAAGDSSRLSAVGSGVVQEVMAQLDTEDADTTSEETSRPSDVQAPEVKFTTRAPEARTYNADYQI
jgi:ubiquitin carboxyl-terminal hydrolase 9/24